MSFDFFDASLLTMSDLSAGQLVLTPEIIIEGEAGKPLQETSDVNGVEAIIGFDKPSHMDPISDIVSIRLEHILASQSASLASESKSTELIISNSSVNYVDPLDIQSLYVLDRVVDDGGSIDVSTEPTWAPEGFTSEDVYAVEFLTDDVSGVVTINLLYSQDPYDHGYVGYAATYHGDSLSSSGLLVAPSGGDPYVLDSAAVYPKCTVTVTHMETRSSGSSTINFNTGILSGSRTTPSTTTTTTRAISVEGSFRNGRCVIPTRH